jgi:galactokinase
LSENTVEKMREAFRQKFGSAPSFLARAPGRVNLIGEHTDYNEGFVMPLAINRAAWIAARPRADLQVVLESENFQRRAQFSLGHIEHADKDDGWSNYTRGVAYILQDAGYTLGGMDAVIWGDVPIGAGLSSSAALEVASALAFAAISNLSTPQGGRSAVSKLDIALFAQRAEVEFVGVNCGIMDQMASSLADSRSMLFLDTRTLQRRVLPLPARAEILVIDSGVARSLAGSKYNERRAECEQAAQLLGVKALRDITDSAAIEKLPQPLRRRARHVVSENNRVLRAVKLTDAAPFGELMNASHSSLRDDYQVSISQLDQLVELLQGQSAVHGARLTGAGFGGACVALCQAGEAGRIGEKVLTTYNNAGNHGRILVPRASEG